MMTSATFRGGSLGLLGQDQGQVGGQVAVLGVFGRLHFEGGHGLKGQGARCPGPFGTGRDQITNGFFDVHLYVNFLLEILSYIFFKLLGRMIYPITICLYLSNYIPTVQPLLQRLRMIHIRSIESQNSFCSVN